MKGMSSQNQELTRLDPFKTSFLSRAFLFQGFEFLDHVHVGAAVLLVPAVIRRRADLQALAHLFDLLAPG
jgi:hypothetical protein